MPTISEENYVKKVYMLTRSEKTASTNAIAEALETKASSVTDMVKKLSKKGWFNYKKYKGVELTEKGRKVALMIIRKHRLWETFLHEKLHFSWDEVHPIAEELEHIESEELVNRLDAFLGKPKFDPHGDPIPDKNGALTPHKNLFASDLNVNDKAIIIGIKDSSSDFLVYLDKIKLVLGAEFEVKDKLTFDNSLSLQVEEGKLLSISHHIASNIYVRKVD